MAYKNEKLLNSSVKIIRFATQMDGELSLRNRSFVEYPGEFDALISMGRKHQDLQTKQKQDKEIIEQQSQIPPQTENYQAILKNVIKMTESQIIIENFEPR